MKIEMMLFNYMENDKTPSIRLANILIKCYYEVKNNSVHYLN